jgi:hypothetical protein
MLILYSDMTTLELLKTSTAYLKLDSKFSKRNAKILSDHFASDRVITEKCSKNIQHRHRSI